MKRIHLTQGRVALVDDSDFEIVSRYIWRAQPAKSQRWVYACAWMPGGKGAQCTMHRLLTGAMPGQVVDHINGDTLDNRRANLRVCTVAQNTQHILQSRNQKRGGFKGVTWNRTCRKWQAGIKVMGKSIHLGVFANAQDAANAYDDAAELHFGEFAGTNRAASRLKESA